MISADTQWRPVVTLRRVVRHLLRGTIALGLLLPVSWSLPAVGVGLGPVVQQSALGQSLRLVIPVILSAGEDVAAECFKLTSADREVDGVPQLVFGRVSLERTLSGAQLVITNAGRVNDPVLRVTVQAGCETSIRREYVLLVDPPPIETPVVAADSGAPGEAAAEPTPPLPAQAQSAAGASSRTSRTAARDGARAAPRANAEPARPARKAAPPKPRSTAKTAPKRPAPIADDQPRLKISAAAPPIPSGVGGETATDAEQARIQQELANAIEAETVVLRQRIVELSALVDRMQQEVRANELAQRAAEEAAKASPVAKLNAWWDANGSLLSAIIGVPLLLAAGLLWRRRQHGARDADWQAAGTASIPSEPTPVLPGPPVLPPPTPAVAAPAAAIDPPPATNSRRAPVARDGANALAVSELLHVTEEARVYVALGHPERAIDVLNEHVRQAPRSMPAAWLMLLDLYHANGRRQDFRRLAEEFHLHCNVQAPLWEDFRTGEADEGGLETFPHILRQVAGIWRQTECREYLEGLLHDNREGRRMGFPLAAYGDILLLLQILDAAPPIAIDSDLAGHGKLDPKEQHSAAAANSPSGNAPQAIEPARAPHPLPPDPTAAARATERPIEFELDLDLDLDNNARDRAKKPAA